MASLNKVDLMGNLGRAPELRSTPAGVRVATLSLATTERWKDKGGETKEHTEWHRVVFFGALAEVAERYTQAGSPVYVEGKLRTRKWQDKDGADRYSTEIVGSKLLLLGKKTPAEATADPVDALPEDDIPF